MNIEILILVSVIYREDVLLLLMGMQKQLASLTFRQFLNIEHFQLKVKDFVPCLVIGKS